MGRWAQRKRSGGSATSAAARPPVNMLSATFFGSVDADVVYSGQVDATALTPGDFETGPGTIAGTNVAQLAANSIRVTFGATITGEDEVRYTGSEPGFVTPDEVVVT